MQAGWVAVGAIIATLDTGCTMQYRTNNCGTTSPPPQAWPATKGAVQCKKNLTPPPRLDILELRFHNTQASCYCAFSAHQKHHQGPLGATTPMRLMLKHD